MARVLVVDDEADVLLAVRLALEMAGYEVAGAGSAEEALQRVDPPPDAILLDLRLPEMDGWGFMDRLREMGLFPRTPVVVISAHATIEAAERAVDLGCRAYLTKPFSAQQLRDVVGAALSPRGA